MIYIDLLASGFFTNPNYGTNLLPPRLPRTGGWGLKVFKSRILIFLLDPVLEQQQTFRRKKNNRSGKYFLIPTYVRRYSGTVDDEFRYVLDFETRDTLLSCERILRSRRVFVDCSRYSTRERFNKNKIRRPSFSITLR